jgi:hypothetical protein
MLPMFFGVYQQLQQKQTAGSGAMGSSALGSEPALIEWPASFEHPWVAYPQNPMIQWELTLGGHVAEEKTLRFSQLSGLPMTYQIRRLTSCNGWSFRAEWHGVLIKHLMPLVSVQTGARYLEIEDVHGKTACFSLTTLIKNQAMLVLFQGSHALSPWHGGPVRFMSFENQAEYCLGQVKHVRFLTKLTREQKAELDSSLVQAGKYYAYDLRDYIDHASEGEIKG